MEDFAAAFFVTMQTRLNAVKEAARSVYDSAAADLGAAVAPAWKWSTHREVFGDVYPVWEIANYVKHNDEWSDTLKRNQKPSCKVLVQLGVARETCFQADRLSTSWVAAKSALVFSGESVLSGALREIAAHCERAAGEAMVRIQADFAPLTAMFEISRETQAAQRRLDFKRSANDAEGES